MGRLKNDDRTREEKMQDVLDAIETCGNITASCKKTKVNRKTLYEWEKTIPEFKSALDAARKIGAQGLEDEAIRRAYSGTLKPVFHQGVKVATVREFSDTLLIFLLKGSQPEKFKDRTQLSGDAANPIVHEVKSTVVFEDMSEQQTKPE